MKIPLALLILGLAFACPAEDEEMLRLYLNEACQKPCRKLGQETVDLSPRFIYAKKVLIGLTSRSSNPPLEEWRLVFGRVLQIADGGLLFKKYSESDTLLERDYDIVFVKHARAQSVATDDAILAFYAVRAGRHSYTDVRGALRTVPCYDCGEMCSAEEDRIAESHFVEPRRPKSEDKVIEPITHETWKPRVKASVRIDAQNLIVKNAGGGDWPTLTLTLVTAGDDEYTNSLPALASSESLPLALTNFVDHAGRRANPGWKFKKVSIGGGGYQTGAYGL